MARGVGQGDRMSVVKHTSITVGDVVVLLTDEDDAIVRSMFKSQGKWEPRTRAIWTSLINKGETVIDIGSYSGIYAIAAAKAGALVVAMEPIPFNAQRIRANCKLNGVAIELLETAASDQDGTTTLRMGRSPNRMNDQASVAGNGVNTVKAKAVRIDSLSFKSRVCLIKIDVELHEPEVIKGGQRLISQDHPVMVVETLSDEMSSKVLSSLPLGYYEVERMGHNRLYRWGA